MGDGLGRQGFARALGAHQQHPPRQWQAVAARLVAEGHVALLEPALQGIESADVRWGGFGRAVLQQFAAGNRLTFFLEHLVEVRTAQLAAAGEAPGGHLPDALLTEATAAVGELLQQFRSHGLSAGLGDVPEQRLDLLLVGQRKIQQGDALLQFPGELPLRGRDHEGLRALAQARGQVAELAADAAVVRVAMEIVEHQQGGLLSRQGAQAFQGR